MSNELGELGELGEGVQDYSYIQIRIHDDDDDDHLLLHRNYCHRNRNFTTLIIIKDYRYMMLVGGMLFEVSGLL